MSYLCFAGEIIPGKKIHDLTKREKLRIKRLVFNRLWIISSENMCKFLSEPEMEKKNLLLVTLYNVEFECLAVIIRQLKILIKFFFFLNQHFS